MTLKGVLIATLITTAPAAALGQTDSGGGVLTEAETMKALAQMLCDTNPYTEQENKTTGEKTGPMQFLAGTAPKVLVDGGYKPWVVGGETFYIRKVVKQPYFFNTSRWANPTGQRTETILWVFAGSEGGG